MTTQPTTTETTKRPMKNPQAWVGKRINLNKWELPEGWETCRKTGKLYSMDDLGVTFSHWVFERSFLIANGIYVEDADWLCEEGYFEIMDVLQKLGKYSEYINHRAA